MTVTYVKNHDCINVKQKEIRLEDLPSNYKWQASDLSHDRVSTKRITPSHDSIIFDKCGDQIIANLFAPTYNDNQLILPKNKDAIILTVAAANHEIMIGICKIMM